MITYRGRRLDGSLAELHQAIDLLDVDTVPESYYLQVIANRVPVPSHTPPVRSTSPTPARPARGSGGPGVANPRHGQQPARPEHVRN